MTIDYSIIIGLADEFQKWAHQGQIIVLGKPSIKLWKCKFPLPVKFLQHLKFWLIQEKIVFL